MPERTYLLVTVINIDEKQYDSMGNIGLLATVEDTEDEEEPPTGVLGRGDCGVNGLFSLPAISMVRSSFFFAASAILITLSKTYTFEMGKTATPNARVRRVETSVYGLVLSRRLLRNENR